MKTESCYMCEAPAVSNEHVPPRCLFPSNAALRKNLITVPSCEEHNSRKSKDDELLRFVIASAPGNNDHCLTIVDSTLRSFDRVPALAETFLPNLLQVSVGSLETASYLVDIPRFTNSLEAIARGLFYHAYAKKLLAKLNLAWAPLMSADLQQAPYLKLIAEAERKFPPIAKGENSSIFQYDIQTSDYGGMCRLRFFEGHPIYLTWRDRDEAD